MQLCLPEIDRMTGQTVRSGWPGFFRSRGYDVALTRNRGDYGAGLDFEKAPGHDCCPRGGGSKVGRYKRNSGNHPQSKGYYKADSAMVVTNSFFTKEAIELARRNNVVLWDRKSYG